MKVTGRYLLEHGVDLAPGYEIDPDKTYWYDTVTNQIHEPLSRRQEYANKLPWVKRRNRREWELSIRERRAVMAWEFEKLPDDFSDQATGENSPWPGMTFGECLQVVTGGHIMSGDSLSLEMAADSIRYLLAEYPSAQKAFEDWLVTRHPFYA